MAYLARDNNINRCLEILSLEEEKGKADLYFANFSRCSLPKGTRRVVEAISTSQHVDSGLVLLGWLASVAGLDRGCHRVIHKARGYINSLSLLIMGGAESGCGKSSALEPFIECIDPPPEKYAIKKLVFLTYVHNNGTTLFINFKKHITLLRTPE